MKQNKELTYFDLLQDIAVLANTNEAPEKVIKASLKILCDRMQWEFGHVFLQKNNGRGKLTSSGIYHCSNKKLIKQFLSLTGTTEALNPSGPVLESFSSEQLIFIEDIADCDNFERKNRALNSGLVSAVFIPLIVKEKTVGVIELFSGLPRFQEKDVIKTLQACANIISLLIDKAIVLKRRKKLNNKLKERQKELNCLFNVSELLKKREADIDKVFRGLVEIIPSAMQYPEHAWAAIHYHEQIIAGHKSLPSSGSNILEADICVRNTYAGKIVVYYSLGNKQFLSQEQQFINEVASKLGVYLEKRASENAVKDSATFYTDVLNSVSAHICVIDSKGTIVATNNAWNQFAHKNGNATLIGSGIGNSYLSVCKKAVKDGEKGVEDIIKGINSVLNGEAGEYIEEYASHSKSEQKWFIMRVTPLENHGSGAVITYSNITGKKLAEIDQQKREVFYRELLNHSYDGVCVINAVGEVIYQSPSNQRILGYNIEDGVEMGIFYYIHPDDREKVEEIFYSLMHRPGHSVSSVYRVLNKAGEYITLENHAVNLIDNPAVNGIVVNFRDVTDHLAAEEEIQKNERYFRTLFEAAPLGIVLLNDKNEILRINEGFHKIFKYKEKEVTGKNIDDFIALPEQVNEAKQISARALSGEIISIETRRADKFGKEINVYVYSVPVKIEGKVHGFYGIYVDISQQKNLIAEIEQSKQQMLEEKMFTDTAINSLPGMFYVLDEQRNVVRWNRNYEMISGYSPEEIPHLNPLDLVADRDKKLVTEKIHEVFDIGHAITEGVIVSKTGEEIPHLLTGYKFSAAGKQYLVGTGIDISLQKQGQMRLEQYALLQSKLVSFGKTALTSGSVDSLLKDAASVINEMLNATYSHVLEYLPATNSFIIRAVAGWPAGIVGHTTLPGQNNFFPGFAYSQEHPVHSSDMMQDKRFMPLKLHPTLGLTSGVCVPLSTRWGKFGLLCAYFKTPRKFAEQELNFLQALSNIISDALNRIVGEKELKNLTEELTKYNEELEHFAYVASHNLRAPVANLSGLIDLFSIETSEEHKDLLVSNITTSINQLDETLKDLVLVVSGKKREQKFHNTTFEYVLNLVIQGINEQIKDKDATIEYNFSSLQKIRYPIVHLQSIFQNAITNAIKYSRPGVKPHIKITSHKNSNGICLEIADNGRGIDLKRFGNRIFRMYQRFHIEEGLEGKGLGLYIIKSQVESLGGRIEVESEVDKGTTFKFYLKN